MGNTQNSRGFSDGESEYMSQHLSFTFICKSLLLLVLLGCDDGSARETQTGDAFTIGGTVEKADSLQQGVEDTTFPIQDTTPQDTAPQDTTAQDTTAQDTTVTTCDHYGFSGEPSVQFMDSTFVEMRLDDMTADQATLSIQFYDMGDGLSYVGPGIYYFASKAEDTNFATCSICAVIDADKDYFAISGSIEVIFAGPEFSSLSAVVRDATFIEVTIDEATYESTPVLGGAVWCIERSPILLSGSR